MKVRPARDVHEQRAAMVVNARAWRAAYVDILPTVVLARMGAPDVDDLRERESTPLSDSFPGDLLVAVEAGAGVDGVVGFAGVRWGETKPFVPDGDAELRTIYVDPPRWGEGVGTDLLEAAVDAVPADRSHLWLDVFEANERGRGFYRSRGFGRAGSAEFEVADETYPTVVYRRPLDGETPGTDSV